MPTITVNDDDFGARVLEAPKPVLVDFWATWCGPCRAVAPILEEVSDELSDQLIVAKLDVDRAPMTAQRFGIRSIPTMILFDGGEAKQAVQGALPKPALMEFIEKSLPGLGGDRVSVDELARSMEASEPIVLLDVRDEGSYHRGHLPTARWTDLSKLDEVLTELGNVPVVLICRSGPDSEALVKERNGRYPQLASLQGGLLEWEGSGRPTLSTKEESLED